jgi:hypothetical protein
MVQKKGIANLLPLVAFGAGVGNAASVTMEDGKIGAGDVGALLGVALEVPALAKVNFSEVDDEALDLDSAEGSEIEAAFAKKLDLSNDVLEGECEEIFGAVKDLALAGKRLAAVVARARAKVAAAAVA